MSEVTLTIDGQVVSVPAGTGLVEAAAELGVEIPVFCYEPRIGPAIGACRMCLVEIEGVPKLQVACATAVREGMVVSTVSDKARDAQESVLEFLLINHPLDCPVCDKGGECPLQDHAFKWGPGASRFGDAKRVNDKPIPISPLIALDRERCILCYRCTRFSDEVAEDQHLVARQRGANTLIATFEGRPWEGANTGNVIELCPVGALTSTQYRFRARPWEAPDHAGLSPWDPVGTNTYNTIRENQVVRVLSRQNDDVDNGWIDDRTRFAYEAYNSPERIVSAQLRQARDRTKVEVSTEVALEWLFDKLVKRSKWQPDPELPEDDPTQIAPEAELWVLSGNETVETVYAIQQLAKQTGGRVVAQPNASGAAPANATAISSISAAEHIFVLGDTDLLDDAPALDLRIRKARQRGASVTVAGVGGTRLDQTGAHLEFVAPGQLNTWATEFCDRIAAAADKGEVVKTEPAVIIYRDGELSAEALTKFAETFGLPRDGSGFIAIPKTANARGLAALNVESVTWDEIFAHPGGVIYHGVDPSRYLSAAAWQNGVRRAEWVAAVDALPTLLHTEVDLLLPAATLYEQDGTLVNLEGRIQRTTAGALAPNEIRTTLQWVAGVSRRMGSKLQGNAAVVYRQLTADAELKGRFPAETHGDIEAAGVLGVNGGNAPAQISESAPASVDGQLMIRVVPYLFDALEVEHVEAMEFLRSDAKLVLHRDDARENGLSRNQRAIIKIDGQDVEVAVVTSKRIARGYARVHAGTGGIATSQIGWHTSPIKAVVGATTAGAEA